MDTPFKCYIYCTKPEEKLLTIMKDGDENYGETYHGKPVFIKTEKAPTTGLWDKRQKVIGEFTCNRVTNLFSNSRFWLDEDDVLHTCLSAAEMRKYANGARGLYGWHISDLRVYDHPRDLWEFTGLRQTRFGWEPVPITRPPQSWRYVEEELWKD